MIPLVLVWIPTVLAVVTHVGMALLWSSGQVWRITTAEGWSYAIASPGPNGWRWAGAAIGGVVGLGISALAVRFGLMRQSYADYDEWERHALNRAGVDQSAEPSESKESDEPPAPLDPESPPPRPAWPWAPIRITVVCAILLAVAGAMVAPRFGVAPLAGLVAGLFGAPIVSGLMVRLLVRRPASARNEAAASTPKDGGSEADPSDMWLMYPHARRESFKEIMFIGPALGLAVVGAWLFGMIGGPWRVDPEDPARLLAAAPMPLWLDALSGVLLGYLIGGGVVWAVRILGSLAYGKEAMGIGDVHLMAAVGACLGWIDPVLAFFVAAFLALWIELIKRCWPGGVARGAMPFGPALAGATILVFLAKPWFEQGLSELFRHAVSLP
ncbi:MAG: A24 family peptidase [Planctomycetota bacterium]